MTGAVRKRTQDAAESDRRVGVTGLPSSGHAASERRGGPLTVAGSRACARARLSAVVWPFRAACAIAAGSLFLVCGTGAQAWFQISEFQDLLEKANAASKGQPADVLKGGTHLLDFGRWWFVPIPVLGFVFLILRAIGLASATALIWLNRKAIRESGEKEAARLKRFLLSVFSWYLLLDGSLIVLTGAIIQLVVAWP